MPIRRVYCETLPFAELLRPRTLELLVRYELELVLAVRPWDVSALAEVAQTLRDRGIPLSIWPMLADERGRWASVHNAQDFRQLALDVCDVLETANARPGDVLLDLEPPIDQARSLLEMGLVKRPDVLARFASGLSRTNAPTFTAASQVLASMVAELHRRGVTTSMAVWPLVALDRPGDKGWQWLLGTPVDDLGARHVSVMMYTSMLEGLSRGTLERRHTTALLAAATKRSVKRWGRGSGISLGCVGTGALRDEPIYRDPTELAEDVAVARAAGCEELSLFELGGVLARGPAEAWLDAFTLGTDAYADASSSSKRVRAARAVARAATWLLAR